MTFPSTMRLSSRDPVKRYASILVSLGVMLFGVSACTTTPERIAELEQARATVQSLERHPEARTTASSQLSDAQNALARADAAVEDGASIDEITHEAYLARRHAEIGLEVVSEAEAVAKLRQAEARRNEVQLEARTLEAERAESLARQRAVQAERSAREAEASRSVAEAAIEEANRLADEMSEMKAEQTERGLVLTLGDVLFDTNESTLKPGAEVTMDRLAEFLRNNPERRLMVEGHTDSRGAEDYNQALSEERANAVTEALVERGIPSDRLRPVGLGEAYPVASNDSPAGMQQNRRVEIVISKQDGTFPASAEERAVARRGN
jgi:outer membrane protein OmpA-like peptidoglycan-associated protein